MDSHSRRSGGVKVGSGSRTSTHIRWRSARDLSTPGLIRDAERLYCSTALTSLPSIT